MAYLEKKIYDLSKSIYEYTEGLTTSVLIYGYLELFKREHRDSCKDANISEFCEALRKEAPIVWNCEKLFIARHCKHFLYKMNEPIHFEVSRQDIEIIKELQKIVKRKISNYSIIVQVNPSSNTAIGYMDVLTDNQVIV